MANQPLKKLMTVLLSMLILLSSCLLLPAAEMDNNKSPVTIEAVDMAYDMARDVYNARGSVVITYSGGVLTADEVEFDKKNNIASATGHAFIKMGEDTLAGDKIDFNIASKTGTAYQGRAFYARNHFYVKGDKIEKTGELTYSIENPTATTCDGDKPDWELTGSELKVTLEGYGLMKDAKLRARDLPVFYTPFMPFPAKTKRQSGFLFPYLAYSNDKNGVDIEVPYFWAISSTMDATFYQRYMDKRGFKEGVEFRYYAGNNSYGTFYGDYMEDTKKSTEILGSASRDWQDMHKRWSYFLNHQTEFDSLSYIRTDIRRVSDNWYFRDFSAHNYYLDHYVQSEQDPFKKIPFQGDESLRSLESSIRLYKGWSNYSLTALISSTDDFSINNNDGTLQKYPEITFTGVKQPVLESPLYYEFSAVYDYFYRGAGQKGHLIDVNPTFFVPINLSNYAKITPQFSFRETFWSRDDDQAAGDGKNGTRSIYNASLSVSSLISRVFDVNKQSWEKVRHEIKPELVYSYTPNIQQNNIPDYAPFIAPVITPVLAPTTNAILEQNAVIWSLTNTFTAKMRDKAGAYSYLEFLRVKLFQTYDINEANKATVGLVERRPLSDMGLEVDIRPHKYFSFAARNQYNVYTGWTITNYDMNINDWRGDNLTIGYRYTINAIEEINVNLKVVITEKLDGTFIARRDQLNDRTVENTIGLIYHKQCWAVGLDFTETYNDTRFILKLSLTGLGKFGL